MNGIATSALLYLVLSAMVVGCAGNKAYRTETIGACTMCETECSNSLELSGDTLADSRIAISFVEINDQGVLRERAQLDRVAKVIRARGGREPGQPQTVLVFVHGWHHNAASRNNNVNRFRKTLEAYSKINPGYAVTGVYVGWRGTTWLFPNLATFWTRKAVSIEVGTGALVDVISTVERASKEAGAMMVSIGHSFGGSALFNATRSLFLSRLDSPPIALSDVPFPSHAAVGDLVLILNPAFEAMQYWPLHAAMASRMAFHHEHVGGPIPDGPPRLLIYQSRDDVATRRAFPAARALSVLFESHARDSESTDSVPALPEWRLDLFGIGHFCELNTHDVVDPDRTTAKGEYVTTGCEAVTVIPTVPKGPVHFRDGSFMKCGQYIDPKGFHDGVWTSPSTGLSLVPRSRYLAKSPFWVVYDTVQSIDHSDINNAGLQCMMADLLSTYTQYYAGRVFRSALE